MAHVAATRARAAAVPASQRRATRARRRAAPRASAAAPSAADKAPAAGASGAERDTLAPIAVKAASTGEDVKLGDVIPAEAGSRTIVCLMTQFGDFDSFEQAQWMVDELPALDAAGVRVVAVGIGSVSAAKAFAAKTNFPIERLYADETAAAVSALGCAPGWGREGGPGAWAANLPFVNGFVKLIVMCAGIGSPGTLKEVIRGYTGDRDADQVFNTGSNVDLPWKDLFKLSGGGGFQRPFELATLRLNNMIDILGDWEALAPADSDLLVQRGASLVLDGPDVLYRHDDQGILGYAPASRLARKALAEDPREFDAKAVCKEAGATRKVDSEDVYAAIAKLEKSKDKEVTLEGLNGRWKLQWTTGTAKVSDQINRRGDGSYFPVTAVQSFDASSMRIRNGIYAGPIKFFFDGPFKFNGKLLEFTFNKVSLALGPLGPWSYDIDAGDWEAKKGKNPFFKIVHADGDVIAARGRGGGLALWKRVGEPEVATE